MRPFADVIAAHLRQRNASPITEALNAGLNRDAIRSVLRGRVPSVQRAAEICDALGLEFYVGPPRGTREPQDADKGAHPPISLPNLERSTQDLVRLTADAGGDPIPDDLWPILATRRRGGDPLPLPSNGNLPPTARPVDVVELAAAAGGGADVASEEVVGCVWFRQDWLDGRGLDPSQCAVIRISGESMEPLLSEGASILVDRKRRRRIENRIFVVRTDDGLIVKRAGRSGDGRWQLLSEHPSWAPAPWPPGAETIGQAIWTARSLV